MPILPQGFWYKVDGKLKHVFFEETPIPQEKRDALVNQLQRTKNYGDEGGASTGQLDRAKEKIYGWYPSAPGAHFKTVTQAKYDNRVFRPNDHRPPPAVPDDRTRPPVFTQYDIDGLPVCVPPYPTDPMAYKFSDENTDQLPVAKVYPDFEKWATEEGGRIPQWNDVVTFRSSQTPVLHRPRTIAAVHVEQQEALDEVPENIQTILSDTPPQAPRSRTTLLAPPTSKSPMPPSRRVPATSPRFQSIERLPAKATPRRDMKIEASPVVTPMAATRMESPPKTDSRPLEPVPIMTKVDSIVNNNFSRPPSARSRAATFTNAFPTRNTAPDNKKESLTLREIEEMQKKLSDQYRWRFSVHGDPLAIKGKARPVRHSHFQFAKSDAVPKRTEPPVHYADSSTFFYNTIPIVPLSFSVGQGLLSEKVIRDRDAKQKFAPKSTPNDRFFIPAFIY